MSKNTLLSELINYVSANSSGNVTVAAPTSGLALDVSGTGRFTGQLTLGSTITNGTFTYTLPSATGTLALTSALSGYLPLSGGTLTGALNGTSASFSGDVTIHSGIGTSVLTIGGTNGDYATAINLVGNNTFKNWQIGSNTGVQGSLEIRSSTVAGGTSFTTPVFSLSTTGTATFSGAVAIGTGTQAINSDAELTLREGVAFVGLDFQGARTSGNLGGVRFYNTSSTTDAIAQLLIEVDGKFAFYNNNNASPRLTIASTGAATFSSSVATTRLLVGGATGNFTIDSYTTSRIGVRSWTDIAGTTNNFFIQNGGNFNYGVLGVVSATGTSTGDVYGLGYTASAGTAMTSVINWTSSGNVGIGTTAPGGKLDISGGQYNTGLIVRSSSTNGTGVAVLNSDTGGHSWYIISTATGNGGGAGNLGFYDDTVGNYMVYFKGNGNVGIGTTSPGRKLDVNGVTRSNAFDIFYNSVTAGFLLTETQWTGVAGANNVSLVAEGGVSGGGNITFFTNGSASERMRITSGGQVLIASTSSTWASTNRAVLEVGGSSSTNALIGLKMGTIPGGYIFHNGTDMYIEQNQAFRLYCIAAANGVYLTAGATSWTANSDERLKTINYSIDNAVEKLMSLRAVNFSWKSDSSNKENLGLIAQDVEKVFPQVIDKGALPNTPSNPITDTTEYLGVRYQELVPVLVKAIQEQQVQINELKQLINK